MANKESQRVFSDDNRIYIIGEFDEEMENGLVWYITKKIKELKDRKDAELEVYINSPGGNGYLLVHLVELLEQAKREGITVKTIVTGHAYSCGSLLAVVGTPGHRYISKYGEHLLHYGSFDGGRKYTPMQIDRDSARWKRWTKQLLKHYEKYAEVPDLEEHMKDDNFWVQASDCIKWKLADKYIEEL